jgi:hypothetical protein
MEWGFFCLVSSATFVVLAFLLSIHSSWEKFKSLFNSLKHQPHSWNFVRNSHQPILDFNFEFSLYSYLISYFELGSKRKANFPLVLLQTRFCAVSVNFLVLLLSTKCFFHHLFLQIKFLPLLLSPALVKHWSFLFQTIFLWHLLLIFLKLNWLRPLNFNSLIVCSKSSGFYPSLWEMELTDKFWFFFHFFTS